MFLTIYMVNSRFRTNIRQRKRFHIHAIVEKSAIFKICCVTERRAYGNKCVCNCTNSKAFLNRTIFALENKSLSFCNTIFRIKILSNISEMRWKEIAYVKDIAMLLTRMLWICLFVQRGNSFSISWVEMKGVNPIVPPPHTLSPTYESIRDEAWSTIHHCSAVRLSITFNLKKYSILFRGYCSVTIFL